MREQIIGDYLEDKPRHLIWPIFLHYGETGIVTSIEGTILVKAMTKWLHEIYVTNN
jgi:hypothetical protein